MQEQIEVYFADSKEGIIIRDWFDAEFEPIKSYFRIRFGGWCASQQGRWVVGSEIPADSASIPEVSAFRECEVDVEYFRCECGEEGDIIRF